MTGWISTIFSMSTKTELFVQMAYALGVGLLIGLERSMGQALSGSATKEAGEAAGSEDRPAGEGEFLGLRTFAILSLVGFLSAVTADRYPLVAPVVIGGVVLLVIAMYKRATELGLGITTELAAIAACGLGMLCRVRPQAAGVIALAITVLLASKRFAHETIKKMRRVELTDTLKFLVAIFIVLPLLPNKALDPYGAFNPFKVGLLVVLISGISFVGYFLTRILGAQKGLGLTGVLGGLTSSTAVTAAMSAEAKQSPDLLTICAFSTLAANATMFGRVLVVVFILDRPLVMRLAWSVGAMAVTAGLSAVVLWFRASRESRTPEQGKASVNLKNPFSVGPAIKFALFFVLILFVAKLAKIFFGNQGLYAAAGLSGLADVDAITLSIAESAHAGSLARKVGAIAITIAVVSNSFVKTGIAVYSGGWRFGRLVGLCLLMATVAGLLVAFLVPG